MMGISQNKKAGDDAFEILPDELVLKIFGHLTQEDLLHTVPLVSTRWATLSRDPVLWKKVEVDLDKVDIREAIGLIRMARRLRSLILVSVKSRVRCDAILNSVSKLDTLKMVGVKVARMDTLVRLVQRSGQLRDVHIRLCRFPPGMPHFLDIFAQCPHLESIFLDMTGLTTPLDKTLERQWGRLQSVTFWPRDRPADAELTLLTSNVAGHLRHLSICLLFPWSYSSLGQFQRLESLELPNSRITDHGLLEGVGKLVSLRQFSLEGSNGLSSTAIQHFFSRPPILLQLKTLELCGLCRSLDDSCLEAMSGCVSLCEVVLTRCHRITRSGLNTLKRNGINVKAVSCKEIEMYESMSNAMIHLVAFGAVATFMVLFTRQ